MAVSGPNVSNWRHSKRGSEMKNASVSTKIDLVTLDGRSSWMKSFMSPTRFSELTYCFVGEEKGVPIPAEWMVEIAPSRSTLSAMACCEGR